MPDSDDTTASDFPKPPEAVAHAATHGAPSGDIQTLPPEVGGREGPEPTRYGDWELRGRCIDF
jgi:hypothetical protein